MIVSLTPPRNGKTKQCERQPTMSRPERKAARFGSRLSRVLSLIALLVLPVSALAATLPEFLISTGFGPANTNSAAVARTLSHAGFNTVLWPLDKLEVCRAAGLKLMAEGVRPEAAASLAAEPAIWGTNPRLRRSPGWPKRPRNFAGPIPATPPTSTWSASPANCSTST